MAKKISVIKPTNNKKALSKQKKLKVAGYARVSTMLDEQESSLDNQKAYFENKIKSNPEWEFAGVYYDQGISGTSDSRPSFQLLVSKAMDGEVDLILTKSISRFSRNVKDLLTYCDMLSNKGVDIWFEEENLRLSTGAKTILTLLGAVAEMESINTSSHITHTLRQKMKNGQIVGAVPIGYKKDGDSLIIDEDTAPIVRMIYELYLEGNGTHTICKELEKRGIKSPKYGHDRWDDSTVLQILKNEKYKGDLLQGKSVTIKPRERVFKQDISEKYYVTGAHDPIIKPEDWEKVQEIMKARVSKDTGRGTSRNGNTYAFSGKIKCLYCGKSYNRRTLPSGNIIWHCNTHTKYGVKYCPKSRSITEKYLKESFAKQLKGWIDGTDEAFSLKEKDVIKYLSKIDNDTKATQNIINTYQQKINKLDKQLRKLDDSFLEGIFNKENYIAKKAELEAQKQDSIEYMNQAKRKFNSANMAKATIQTTIDKIKTADIDSFNEELFKLLVKQIVVGEVDDYEKETQSINWFYNIEYLDMNFGEMIKTDDNEEPVEKMRRLRNIDYTFKDSKHVETVILLCRANC